MKVKELIEELKKYNDNATIEINYFCFDEEIRWVNDSFIDFKIRESSNKEWLFIEQII